MSGSGEGFEAFSVQALERRAWRAREAVFRLALLEFDAGAVRLPVVGTQLTRPGLADPLAGIRAAVLMRRAAVGFARDVATDARGMGWTWDDIAAALGLPFHDRDDSRPREVRAFEQIAGPTRDLRAPAWVRWTCNRCGARVSDHGPEVDHPRDREIGHAAACPRERAALAAWRYGFDEPFPGVSGVSITEHGDPDYRPDDDPHDDQAPGEGDEQTDGGDR